MVLGPRGIAAEFFGAGRVVSAEPFGNGHINQTFLVRLDGGREAVVQRINLHVFPEPAALMHNIERVCQHLAQKYARVPEGSRRHLSIWPTCQGKPFFQDQEGECWRAYERIGQVASFDRITQPQQAYQVGKAFAEFQALLSDLPAPRLHDTIADFHHTPKRFRRLLQAIEADSRGRAASAQPEIDFVLQRGSIMGRLVEQLEASILPERITHNDTKLNNLLFSQSDQTPLCVVDLDTVMPGLVHYDFGDMVRTATNRAEEDEENLSLVAADGAIFEPLARGYLEGGANFLTPAEKRELVFSGILMTLEVAMRFLTDFLEGDHYFKIHHERHNLQRTRAQLALVKSLESQRQEWEQIVAGL